MGHSPLLCSHTSVESWTGVTTGPALGSVLVQVYLLTIACHDFWMWMILLVLSHHHHHGAMWSTKLMSKSLVWTELFHSLCCFCYVNLVQPLYLMHICSYMIWYCTFSYTGCGAPGLPLGGRDGLRLSYTNTTINSIAVYSCDTGYILIGNNTRMCQRNGNWSGHAPSCRNEWVEVYNLSYNTNH